jgi:hypothetical protein
MLRDDLWYESIKQKSSHSMMKQHQLITLWKTGMGILVRVIFLSFLLNILLFPLRGIQSINGLEDWAKILISIIYVIGIVPFLLPLILRMSGLVTRPVDEIDGTGELNEASKRKMRELEAERTLVPHNMP